MIFQNWDHVRRNTLVISLILITLTLIVPSVFASPSAQSASPDCITCHEDVYLKAINYDYKHSILRDNCTYCHIRQSDEGNVKATFSFSTLQKEQIVFLPDIPEDLEYEADVMVTDIEGKRCLPTRVKMNPENIWTRDDDFSSLNEISNVTVDEVKKGAFVKAVISWNTNAYSTSELEYKTKGKRKSRLVSGDIFTKKHRVVINRLKHKRIYTFKAISRDINGSILESKEYSFDTSKGSLKTKEGKYTPPAITNLQVFTVDKSPGLFMKVFANKPSELTIRLIEISKAGAKHGFGLLDPSYARIDTCLKCHPRGTSHPVGVRAEGNRIRTPDELPTIEDGIITCVTCHNPHGGNNAFFARFDRNKDICILCHIGGY